MPRLVGKQSNSGLYVGLFLVIVIAVAVVMEYFGFIDLIDGFGNATNILNSSY
jgi:hypothetical protein